jgi:hypothetical protein
VEITHEFFGREFLIDFDIKITSPGCPATGPSYASGGEPASPMEWEIDGDVAIYSLKLVDTNRMMKDEDGKWESIPTRDWIRDQCLDLPDWLKEAVTEWLHESDEVAGMADELAADDGVDPDYERDRASDD